MNAKIGRPPMYKNKMKKIMVVLDKDTVIKAKEAGGGNLSKGLRICVAAMFEYDEWDYRRDHPELFEGTFKKEG